MLTKLKYFDNKTGEFIGLTDENFGSVEEVTEPKDVIKHIKDLADGDMLPKINRGMNPDILVTIFIRGIHGAPEYKENVFVKSIDEKKFVIYENNSSVFDFIVEIVLKNNLYIVIKHRTFFRGSLEQEDFKVQTLKVDLDDTTLIKLRSNFSNFNKREIFDFADIVGFLNKNKIKQVYG